MDEEGRKYINWVFYNKCFDLYVAVGRDRTSCNLATKVVTE